MQVFNNRAEVTQAVGTEIGVSEWIQISQERIDRFADATGDHQWIHSDPERAAQGPFGATVAHGYLTLALLPLLGAQVYAFAGDVARISYGLNSVRFMSPITVGSRVRNRIMVLDSSKDRLGERVTLRHTIELRGEDKPACVAETVTLLVDTTGSAVRTAEASHD